MVQDRVFRRHYQASIGAKTANWTAASHTLFIAKRELSMTIWTRLIAAILMPIVAVPLASCGSKLIEGTYNATNTRMQGIVVTFGKNSFSFHPARQAITRSVAARSSSPACP